MSIPTTRPYYIKFNRVTGVDFQVIRVRDGAEVFRSYWERDCQRWIQEHS